MTSNITTCNYSPDSATTPDPLTGNKLTAVQYGGTNDISNLIGRIAQTHFKYTGDKEYEITLKRGQQILFKLTDNSMNLELKFNNNKWELINGATTTAVDDSQQHAITQDLNITLDKIRNAWSSTAPSTPTATATSTTTTAAAPISPSVPNTSSNGAPTYITNFNNYGSTDSTQRSAPPSPARPTQGVGEIPSDDDSEASVASVGGHSDENNERVAEEIRAERERLERNRRREAETLADINRAFEA